MYMEDITCHKCNRGIMAASDRGTYLKRVSPKGEEPVVMECALSCTMLHGSRNDALIKAITG